MTLVLKGRLGKNRYCPAIFADRCTDTHIENVTVHHADGMGLIAQRCTDVTLDGFDVTLPPEGRRAITTTADATHFVGCRGKIQFADCTFENMLDDATNVHGMYVKIAQQRGPRSVLVRRMHSQQVGTPFAGVDDRLRFSDHARLAPLFESTVTSVTRLNEEVDLMELAEELPQDIAGSIADGLVADNLSWQPDPVSGTYPATTCARASTFFIRAMARANLVIPTQPAALLRGYSIVRVTTPSSCQ